MDTVASALRPCAVDAGMQEVAAKEPAARALVCGVEANPVTSASDAPSWVVNDRKPEFSELTRRNPDAQAEGLSLSPQGISNMDVDSLRNLAKRAKSDGDEQPIRDVCRVISYHRMSPHAFIALDETTRISRVERFACVSRLEASLPASMAEPKRLIRRFQFAMARLCRQFPDVGLPLVDAPDDTCLHQLPVKRRVGLLAQELAAWRPPLIGGDTVPGNGRALKPDTAKEYVGKGWLLAGICDTAIGFNEEIGIKALIAPVTVDVWLPIVIKHYSAKGVAPFISAIVRIGIDTLGKKDSDVKTLRGHVGHYFAKHALTTADVKKARALTDLGNEKSINIWTMSAAMMLRARQSGRLRPIDRDSRASSAVAAEILTSNPGIQPCRLAELNFDLHVRGTGHTRQVALENEDDPDTWQPLTPSACDKIDELQAFRTGIGRPSPWLFQRSKGKGPQERRVAMNALATNIAAVLGRRVTAANICDSLRINTIDFYPACLKEISEATGLKSVRSAERRYAIILDAPDSTSEREAA